MGPAWHAGLGTGRGSWAGAVLCFTVLIPPVRTTEQIMCNCVMTRSPQSNFLQHYHPSTQQSPIRWWWYMIHSNKRWAVQFHYLSDTHNSFIRNVVRLTQTTCRHLTLMPPMLVSGCRLPLVMTSGHPGPGHTIRVISSGVLGPGGMYQYLLVSSRLGSETGADSGKHKQYQ